MTHSLMAEFASADAMVSAVKALRAIPKLDVETFTPFDVPSVDAALSLERSNIGKLAGAGGAIGVAVSYLVQWWSAVVAYPLNVGARPAHAVPALLLITFECAVLGAALAAFVGLCVVLRFPRLWAREDEVPGFERATIDRFWIRVNARSGDSLESDVRGLLTDAGVLTVTELRDA